MSRTRSGTPKIVYKMDKLLKLEYLRRKYGYSQEEMAEILGVNKSTYCQKANGRQSFKIDEMMIIMIALNKKAKKNGESVLTLNDIFLDWKLQKCN